MEESLRVLLAEFGVNSGTIDVLESEMILTKEIFFSLGDSHLQHILPKLKVVQHALLLNIWQVNFGHFGRQNGVLVLCLWLYK